MNATPLSSGPIDASQLPLELMARNPNIPEEQKVAEVTRQFEAVLVRQILAEARKTVIHSNISEPSAISGIYDDLVNQTLADSVSRSGMLGLADSLREQLSRPATGGSVSAAASANPVPGAAVVASPKVP